MDRNDSFKSLLYFRRTIVRFMIVADIRIVRGHGTSMNKP
jgi:hypothetical protein